MRFESFPQRRVVVAAALLVLAFSIVTRANHGPGASGGGSATISGETLKPGAMEFDIREDYSQFEHFDHNAAIARAIEGGGSFDALDHGFLTTIDGSVGVVQNFQLGASLGYFVGRDFISADRAPDGSIETSEAQPTGLTDLVLTGKYRVLQGQPGNLAIVGGVIFPTGRSDVHLVNGESLSPTDQPGTGRWGFPIGVAYSRFLTSHLTVDASVLYTFRLQRDDFRVGNRFDVGLALAYRITESIKQFPQFSVFAELNSVYLYRDRSDEEGYDPNSGGETIYITPGGRVRFGPHTALTLAPSFPVYQRLNGNQGKVDFKLAMTFSLSF
jgi:hypothetical protein